MARFEGVIFSDVWLQSQFTQVQFLNLKSKFIAFHEIFKEDELRDLLCASGADSSNKVDFKGFLKDGEAYAYLLNVLVHEHGSPNILDVKDPITRVDLVLDHAEKIYNSKGHS